MDADATIIVDITIIQVKYAREHRLPAPVEPERPLPILPRPTPNGGRLGPPLPPAPAPAPAPTPPTAAAAPPAPAVYDRELVEFLTELNMNEFVDVFQAEALRMQGMD